MGAAGLAGAAGAVCVAPHPFDNRTGPGGGSHKLRRTSEDGRAQATTSTPLALAAPRLVAPHPEDPSSVDLPRHLLDLLDRLHRLARPLKAHTPKALADLVEAVLGAVYLDSGGDLGRVWQVRLQDTEGRAGKMQANQFTNKCRQNQFTNKCQQTYSQINASKPIHK